MRVLHCCLAAFYIDDFGYQENILPRIHKEQGHEVKILASTETYLAKTKLGYVQSGSYTSSDGIAVTRLPYVSWLPVLVVRKLRLYKGLAEQIEHFDPDVIFVHDCQFLDIHIIAERAARRGTTVYVDCHTDFVNSGRNWVSQNVLHRFVYRACARMIAPWTRRFFATLPLRGDFLREIYGIPDEKIELLPFGVDDISVPFERRAEIRSVIRQALDILPEQVVFISGGKIDGRKNIDVLARAFVERYETGDLGDAVLVLFGKPEPELEVLMGEISGHPNIRIVGWVVASDVYRYLWAADVAVFPGTHSVLWEEAVGLGLPCLFKRWKGIEHVDLGGNCVMLDTISELCLGEALVKIAANPHLITAMRQVATTHGPETFSYSRIARRALLLEQD